MRQKIYTIKDFDFKPHGVIEGAVQGLLNLPNNITVSIVGGMNMLRGDGVDTFEVAAWWGDQGDWIKLSDYDDVLSYVDKDRLPIILLDLSKK
jgi:hypothetical protein